MSTIQTSAIDMNKGKAIIVFDCLHDMGDPARATVRVQQSVSRDGVWLTIEPFAND
jgi:hypothetical protein